MLALDTFLRALKYIGPIAAKAPDVMKIINAAVKTLHPGDQETARMAYKDLIADNAEGFARLDAKLEAAEKI